MNKDQGDEASTPKRPRRRLYEAPETRAQEQPSAQKRAVRKTAAGAAKTKRTAAPSAQRGASASAAPASAGEAAPSQSSGQASGFSFASGKAAVMTESLRPAAQKLIKRYAAISTGAGLIPIPLVDSAAVSTVLLVMVQRLCRIYGVAYSATKGRALIAALLGGLQSGMLAYGFLKAIPVLGTFSLISIPAVTGGTTYLTGAVFANHFEAGGTLDDFNPLQPLRRDPLS